jgi:hypothetical protein
MTALSFNHITEDYIHLSVENLGLGVGKPYRFVGYEFFNNILSLRFIDQKGKEHLISVSPKGGYGLTLENFTSIFLTEKELVSLVTKIDSVAVSSVLPLLEKEVFVKQEDMNWKYGYLLTEDYRISSSKAFYNNTRDDNYYTFETIMIMPKKDGLKYPYYINYAILSQYGNRYALPLNDETIKFIYDGKSQREKFRIEQEESVRQEREREQEITKETSQYKNSLIRKFGRKNAEIIMEGAVRIGFTKSMCEEAWGSPYNITTVSTKYGTAEAWWYGSGDILYFRGNKLVIIQN